MKLEDLLEVCGIKAMSADELSQNPRWTNEDAWKDEHFLKV